MKDEIMFYDPCRGEMFRSRRSEIIEKVNKLEEEMNRRLKDDGRIVWTLETFMQYIRDDKFDYDSYCDMYGVIYPLVDQVPRFEPEINFTNNNGEPLAHLNINAIL